MPPKNPGPAIRLVGKETDLTVLRVFRVYRPDFFGGLMTPRFVEDPYDAAIVRYGTDNQIMECVGKTRFASSKGTYLFQLHDSTTSLDDRNPEEINRGRFLAWFTKI